MNKINNNNNMDEKLNKIIEETVDTIIDTLDETIVDYMYEHGDYELPEIFESKFVQDHNYLTKEVITELYNRLKNI